MWWLAEIFANLVHSERPSQLYHWKSFEILCFQTYGNLTFTLKSWHFAYLKGRYTSYWNTNIFKYTVFLTHLMLMISFFIPWKHQKISDFLFKVVKKETICKK